ncbi:RNA 2',3'-cyclic phosphodiesterase [Persephonella sp.]|nr:RNA 2',3'-cyclic phosphodiesterase [Aquificota bacterium]
MEKRIFIGSFVKIDGFDKKYTLIKKEFGGLIKGRWIPEENFHITYRFIGNVNPRQLEDIKTVLKPSLGIEYEANLIFRGVGAFPNLLKPRVFFLKVDDTRGVLDRLNGFVNEKLALLGYPPEKRPFKPHITLKRVKGYSAEKFQAKVREFSDYEFGKQAIIKLSIIESILSPGGAKYKIVE